MNTNNTERGGGDGWEEMRLGSGIFFRYRYDGDTLLIEDWSGEFSPATRARGKGEWYATMDFMSLMFVRFIAEERTATRDRDAALAELAAKWRHLAATDLASKVGRQYWDAQEDCANELEALLTNPTAHVEADRQGEVMRQMYEALTGLLAGFKLTQTPLHHVAEVGTVVFVAQQSIEAYEALHGTEGVRCNHEWIDMRNQVIKSGEMCRKCGLMREPTT